MFCNKIENTFLVLFGWTCFGFQIYRLQYNEKKKLSKAIISPLNRACEPIFWSHAWNTPTENQFFFYLIAFAVYVLTACSVIYVLWLRIYFTFLDACRSHVVQGSDRVLEALRECATPHTHHTCCMHPRVFMFNRR